jgi:hypothetical protein
MNDTLPIIAVWAVTGLRPAVLWTAAATLAAAPFAAMLLAPTCGINARHNPRHTRAGRRPHGRP